MKKTELVHVHGLLGCVAEDFLARGVVDEAAFEEYRRLGVSPTSLRASRDDHEAAVRVLGHLLSSAAERADAADGDPEGGGRTLRSS